MEAEDQLQAIKLVQAVDDGDIGREKWMCLGATWE